MNEIWAESARFNTTSQNIEDMNSIKEGLNLEIQEICRQLNGDENENDPPTRIEILSTEKQEPTNWIET